jgi:hypothetical protein
MIMIIDQNDSLCKYVCQVLDRRDFVVGDNSVSLEWISSDYKCSADGLRTITGWTVSLVNATLSPVVYIAFADTVAAEMQTRLKTLIGHCIVERILLITPWRVIYTGMDDRAPLLGD